MTTETAILTPKSLLEHWLEHRRLTRRTIEAFPEKHLYTFTPAEPLRTFGAMMNEVIGMIRPSLQCLLDGTVSTTLEYQEVSDKVALLRAHDEIDMHIQEVWPSVPVARLTTIEKTYFERPAPLVGLVLYLIDNEIHHRGQGYIYLRLLGNEPPSFYRRS